MIVINYATGGNSDGSHNYPVLIEFIEEDVHERGWSRLPRGRVRQSSGTLSAGLCLCTVCLQVSVSLCVCKSLSPHCVSAGLCLTVCLQVSVSHCVSAGSGSALCICRSLSLTACLQVSAGLCLCTVHQSAEGSMFHFKRMRMCVCVCVCCLYVCVCAFMHMHLHVPV